LVDEGVHSPELFFNLGSAYFKSDSLAQSIYYFEKAKKLKPNDADLKHNLALAYGRQQDDIDKFPEFLVISWLKNLAFLLGTNIWLVAAIVCFWLTLLLFYFNGKKNSWLFSKSRWRIPLIAGMCFLLFSWASYYFKSSIDSAIVMSSESVIKNKPNDTAAELLTIHAGLKVEVLDAVDQWYQVKLTDGTTGWMQKKNARKL